MELSKRLEVIASHVDKCESVADIGTDHGYIPIYLVKKGICNRAVASDINKGPMEKAKINVTFEGLKEKIDVYLGAGLKPLKVSEVDGIIIAGMGGNLTRDIILADLAKVKKYDFMVLQPAQNPEVLREFLYNNSYEIIDEDLIKEEGKYYELFKVKYSRGNKFNKGNLKEIDYEISPILREKNHPLINEYINMKKEKYEKIKGFIKEESEEAEKRKKQLADKINLLGEMI